MKKIVEIVPASPGWYSRWRFDPERTVTYPVAVWALVEDEGDSGRGVVGVDSAGQWPGGTQNEEGADFVRYIFRPLEAGMPVDISNPCRTCAAAPGVYWQAR